MPSIQGIYRQHPINGADGVYLKTSAGVITGQDLAALPAPKGNQTAADYSIQISTAVTALFEQSRPVADFPPGDPHLTTPEPFCLVSSGQYICQPFVVTIIFTSLHPLVLDSISVGGGAEARETL